MHACLTELSTCTIMQYSLDTDEPGRLARTMLMQCRRPQDMFHVLKLNRHPYFRRNLPRELISVMADGGAAAMQGAAERQLQSLADLRHVLNQARSKGS